LPTKGKREKIVWNQLQGKKLSGFVEVKFKKIPTILYIINVII